jgi:hypothetical protein
MVPPRQTRDRVLRRDTSVRRRTSTASRFLRTGVLLLAALAGDAPAAGQALERRLVVVVPEAGDARVAHTRAAVEFWNRSLADLGLDVQLREAALVVGSPDMRAIETFARFVSQRGGRIPRGASGPQPPPGLTALGGDVVVLLSRQPLLPFAWPPIGSPDHLVAIRALRPRRPRDDTVLRNVIAHELGHTLGLRHNRGGASLMCGPCSSLAAEDSPGGWLPLTRRDRARLRVLHGSVEIPGEPGGRGIDAVPD